MRPDAVERARSRETVMHPASYKLHAFAAHSQTREYFAQMRRPSSYTSVVKSGLHVYEVRPCEGHRNVGFRCAAVWSAVVAKVTGAIGYARHQSRSRDALIRQG